MSLLKRMYLSFFLGKRFYRFMAAIILLFAISSLFPFLFNIALISLGIMCCIVFLDCMILYSKKNPADVQRILPERMSNGDENIIYWNIENRCSFRTSFHLVDEFPETWQIRHFRLESELDPGERITLQHVLFPKQRGEYFFGNIYLYLRSPWRLVIRRKTYILEDSVSVFPSFRLLRQFEFMAHISEPGNIGYKQVRKTGHSIEFEQIREYVGGDDIRSINWKATGRSGGQLMINLYTDEKSQPVYCVIDKGRTMKMAFNELSLLDYAVNATLAISAVALARQDKAGFISFGDKTGDYLPAKYRSSQMAGIVQALYRLDTKFLESDFAFLHNLIKTNITQRSLLILFTNFESLTALNRQLPYLRNISRKHLLLVVFFENTSVQALASGEATDIEGLYEKVIAEKFILEKKMIVKELQRYGIPALLTAPEKLSIEVVNKYLQIKARREI